MGNVLVTGCNGFIGSVLTNALLNNGYKVIGLSTGTKQIVTHKNFKYISINLTDSIAVEKIFSEHAISLVIHLAAIAHLNNRKKISWNEFYRVNTLASKTIFQCAINSGAKIFYASTVDVYGSMKVPIITEDSMPMPITDYGRSKFIAENILIDMANKKNHKYIIGRFAPVYSKNFMKDVFKRIYLKYPKLAFQVGNGNSYHFVSVNNVVDFILEWVKLNGENRGIYNICDIQPINSEEFISLEKKNGNSQTVLLMPIKLFTSMKYVLDICCKLFNNQKLNKIRLNLYKLIDPPKYSTNKMEEVIMPRWNLKNTVYEEMD